MEDKFSLKRLVEAQSNTYKRAINKIKNARKQNIDIEIFRSTINHILKYGSITRRKINLEYSKRTSSGIMLILGQVPLFNLNTARPMSIQLNSKTS